ncbi:Uncharacterised protein [Vibrio cholerae]|uniref:Uncharacterized protein n=1 Tax=Vibrio cholerae TaxID=666 RepID=A0A655QLU1_VIBCL|nr:Uncharacterised protein [Vibrio cholerae]CSA65128.1 Uncharacterised protein [Vibrio cholerae]CSB28321.1 Uncharacterised protein [Vibrio cholerae]CSB60659.1 Uncharacterised protein [Vibrio cholerae]CSB66888.1 Uncharacterised protein [Vibrio cholerae]
MVRSALPQVVLHTKSAAIAPAAAAALVLRKILPTDVAFSKSDTINCEPPLKPNQPNHRINVPSVANGMLEPGIG